ncbi:uncharacterized protein LOC114318414 [Camellia sinensis]|uniref:uncharacterized protein LOC114318414 n=1 Tax=Camellia sinensis TaxID=4442 RepID=UPI00103579A9|nr:uncharacterized protein LOC114318414 [Camellia sinensis]
MCCNNGTIVLPPVTAPNQMIDIFSDQTVEGCHFRQNIRSYNHVFSFTSIGVHVDENLATRTRGVYTFRAQGSIYHKIRSLLPNSSDRLRYLQLYVYDIDHENENRMSKNRELHLDLLDKIKNILNAHNPFVHTFRQLAQRPDIHECRLQIKEQPRNRPQYNLPTAPEVAVVLVGAEEAGNLRPRDIIVQSTSGQLLNIPDITGYYDPLQYPLLLPYGSYGWDANSRSNVGRRTILPSSFVGSPRDMYQRYQDAMALVQKYGKPDLFLTMTCNPNWPEIKAELLLGQSPHDRPDLLTRVFHSKFDEMKTDILTKHVLGKVLAYAYVIEYQKRGLPHAHMVIILDENDKLRTPDDYDNIFIAEIPDKRLEPRLYSAVLKHMIHGPCGMYNERSPCMTNGRCKRRFPKSFSPITTLGNDSYHVYRRREGESVPLESNPSILVDNSWVIPYNPWLLLEYDCHINLEICSSVTSVKYLYKYVYKGPDRVALEVRQGPNYDEVQQFIDGRWQVWFYTFQDITNVLGDEYYSRTMLTQFFQLNVDDETANRYLYREIPQHYRWCNSTKIWQLRLNRQRVIGRIYTVSPSEGERFYLRILLSHIRGPKSFDHLLMVNGIAYPTFKQAAEHHGLLEHDDSIRQCLLEAVTMHMPSTLRRLFVTILVYCMPTGVQSLWDEIYPYLIEDYISSNSMNNMYILNKTLQDINRLLLQHNKNISEYDLPEMTMNLDDNSTIPKVIQDELSIVTLREDLNSIPRGTGKTYLYRALLASVRSQGRIAIATATSGIAVTLLPGGRTAHSRFKIPLNPEASSMCSITKQSDLAELIRHATIIIWDEATMTNRYAFGALNRTLIDITGVDYPFGAKLWCLVVTFVKYFQLFLKVQKLKLLLHR